ncbi:uncharacterized protein KY384_000444 [Bacidia gigantensis]|uniref:uncharacterized protein n=1 Tax=Bacidia gigantensis TaxID=2732470 RepID=UPI001D049FC2|nr:uncharacterized protein KY384_000444 [Bacidia gigantensis]KAG8525684.1 hypothetical protein KY384_000444 [Bacidia gigantensis]
MASGSQQNNGQVAADTEADQYDIDATLTELGWYPEASLSQYIHEDDLNEAPFCTPFGTTPTLVKEAPEKNQFLKDSQETKQLYQELSRERNRYLDQLTSVPGLEDEGYNPHIIYPAPSNTQSDGRPWNPEVKIHECGASILNILLSDVFDLGDPSGGPPGKLQGRLSFQRIADPEAERWEYFIINRDIDSLIVNGQTFRTQRIIGPLPDFAVIQFSRTVMFWFRTKRALRFKSPNWTILKTPPAPKSYYDESEFLEASVAKGTRKRVREHDEKRQEDIKRQKRDEHHPTMQHERLARLRQEKEQYSKMLQRKKVNSDSGSPPLNKTPSDSAPPAASVPGALNEQTEGVATKEMVEQNNSRDIDQARKPSGNVDQNLRAPISSKGNFHTILYKCLKLKPKRLPADFDEGDAQWLRRIINLDDEKVCLPIASILCALKEARIPYSFGQPTQFTSWNSNIGILEVYGIDSDTFIIPLVLQNDGDREDKSGKISDSRLTALNKSIAIENEEAKKEAKIGAKKKSEKAKEPKVAQGHIILAVAKRTASPSLVDIDYYDSCSGFLDHEQMRHAALNVIEHSGWMFPANLNSEHHRSVPQQKPGLSCGIHAVLNAWAVMLGLDPEVPMHRRLQFTDGIYQDARMLFNYACMGRVDSETIRTFLTEYGFCVAPPTHGQPQAPNTHPQQQSRDVQSVFMNRDVLRQYLGFNRGSGTPRDRRSTLTERQNARNAPPNLPPQTTEQESDSEDEQVTLPKNTQTSGSEEKTTAIEERASENGDDYDNWDDLFENPGSPPSGGDLDA